LSEFLQFEVSASQRQMTSYWLPHAFYTHSSGLICSSLKKT
jgi:hypothetical protein